MFKSWLAVVCGVVVLVDVLLSLSPPPFYTPRGSQTPARYVELRGPHPLPCRGYPLQL
jgi:hypothetical protein